MKHLLVRTYCNYDKTDTELTSSNWIMGTLDSIDSAIKMVKDDIQTEAENCALINGFKENTPEFEMAVKEYLATFKFNQINMEKVAKIPVDFNVIITLAIGNYTSSNNKSKTTYSTIRIE